MARFIKKTNFDYMLQNAALAMGFLSDEEISIAFTATRATLEEAVIGALRQAISELKPLSFVKTLSVDELHEIKCELSGSYYELPEDFVEVYKVYNAGYDEQSLSFEMVNDNIQFSDGGDVFQYFYSPNDEKSLNVIENVDALFLRVAAYYVAMIILPVVNPMKRDEVYIALQQAKGDYSSRNKQLAHKQYKSEFADWIESKQNGRGSYGYTNGVRYGRGYY